MCQRAIRLNPNRRPKSIFIPASLLFLAAVANAQFLRVQMFTIEAPGKKTPVIADITVRATSITPWGTYTQVLKGKFWRSRDGKSRQDDSFGTSFLHSPKTDTWVDRELQTAMETPSSPPLTIRPSLSSFDPRFNTRHEVSKGMLNGRAVLQWSSGDTLHADYWNDIRLGVPIQIRTTLGGTETIQELTNIEEREPNPDLFKIPEGFSVLKCKPTASAVRPQPPNRPASCVVGR
jgi:hypothetical protein